VSEAENFLSRWARLKREAAETPDDAAPDTPATGADEPTAKAIPPPAPKLEFDLSTLPPVESITAATDIRAFLAPGVPPELTRAALRRAWVVDPKIRDFIGIAENQWDFTAADAMPGFGPLGPLDDVRRMVARVMGEEPETPEAPAVVASAENAPAVAAGGESPVSGSADVGATRSETIAAAAPPATAPWPADQGEAGEATRAVHKDDPDSGASDVPHRRSHGGALPKVFTGN